MFKNLFWWCSYLNETMLHSIEDDFVRFDKILSKEKNLPIKEVVEVHLQLPRIHCSPLFCLQNWKEEYIDLYPHNTKFPRYSCTCSWRITFDETYLEFPVEAPVPFPSAVLSPPLGAENELELLPLFQSDSTKLVFYL